MKRNTFFIVFNGLSVAKNDETSAHYSRIFIQKYDHFVSLWYCGIFINNILLSPENQINLMIDDHQLPKMTKLVHITVVFLFKNMITLSAYDIAESSLTIFCYHPKIRLT